MKLHKLEVYVIDFDDHGLENVVGILEDALGLSVTVIDAETAEINDWKDRNDDHLLNITTNASDFRKYFPKPYESTEDYLDGGIIKHFRD
jgi:hypothetical protein